MNPQSTKRENMATSMKSSKPADKTAKNPTTKPTQNDLRRLMREKQQSLKDKEKRKIDSPLAKYNDLGNLYCALCNIQVKSELIWPAHVNGKAHKQNLVALKTQKQAAADQKNFKIPAPPSSVKRPSESTSAGSTKKAKLGSSSDGASVPPDFFDVKTESPKSDESSDDEEMDTNDTLNITTPSQVPPGFFENPKKGSSNLENNKEAANLKLNSKEALPEGFFDDPVKDAKVRKVEYKDPVEEEWEKFQREIADATIKAQAIVDEEEEESTAERQIEEIDEQIHNWARVDALQRKKEELAMQQKNADAKNTDDEMSPDEQEFEEFLDWRAKGSWS